MGEGSEGVNADGERTLGIQDPAELGNHQPVVHGGSLQLHGGSTGRDVRWKSRSPWVCRVGQDRRKGFRLRNAIFLQSRVSNSIGGNS